MNYASTILRAETAARQKNCSPDGLCAGVRYREMADRHSPKCGARPALSIDSTPLCSMRNKNNRRARLFRRRVLRDDLALTLLSRDESAVPVQPARVGEACAPAAETFRI